METAKDAQIQCARCENIFSAVSEGTIWDHVSIGIDP